MDYPSNRNRMANLDLSGYNVNQRNNSTQNRSNINGPATLDLATQLQKLGKVRESLYSQNGWSSSNVNQDSKWDVGDTMIDPHGKSHRKNTINCDTGTNIWSTDYHAQQAIFPNANCSGASGASYSGTGPMPKPFGIYYDDDELAKRSGVESILSESEPIASQTRHAIGHNWPVDTMNSRMGFDTENRNAQHMNFNSMNTQYTNYDPRATQYTGYDPLCQHTTNNECNSNDVPLHLQFQGLKVNQGFNAQMTEPNLNPITTTYPAAARESFRGYNPTIAQMGYPRAASEWPAPHHQQYQQFNPLSYGFPRDLCHNIRNNNNHYYNNHAPRPNGNPRSAPMHPQNYQLRKHR